MSILADNYFRYCNLIARYAEANGQDVDYFAAVACVRRHGGRRGGQWLLGLSNSTDDRRNKFCFPGGGIKKRETPEAAAVRECREETGIKCHAIGKAFEWCGWPGVAFVECIADSTEFKKNHEFQALGWFTEDQFNSLNLYHNVRGLVARLTNGMATARYSSNAGTASDFHEKIEPLKEIPLFMTRKTDRSKFKIRKYANGKFGIEKNCCEPCRRGKQCQCSSCAGAASEGTPKKREVPAIEKKVNYQLYIKDGRLKVRYAATADNCGTGAGGFQPGNECAASNGGKPSPPSIPQAAAPRGEQEAKPVKKKAIVGEMVAARRVGAGKEARIVLANGTLAPSHIKPSMVPPDYTDVTISIDPNADVLMKARDGAGRIVTRYKADYSANNAAVKFARSKEMLEKADLISQQNQENRKDPAKREEADCTWLIEEQATRPGSESDTKAKHKAYGATNLRDYHVVETVSGVWLRFVGKKGVKHSHHIKNPELAKMLLERKRTAGERGGRLFNTDEKKLNAYIHTLDGGKFTAKDFRTLKANKLAIAAISKVKRLPKTMKEYKSKVKEVAEYVSKVLGNRPSEALKSYIDPVLFSAWRPAETTKHAKAVAA